LTFDGISAYTSASSSNNPYDESGASGSSSPTPWQASSGASRSDQLASASVNYSHLTIEITFGMLMFPFQTSMIIHQLVSRWVYQVIQRENTEISVKANAYLDQWRPIYPLNYENMHSMDQFSEYHFSGVPVSIKMVLDRKPIYQLPLNPTKRQTEIPILLQFLRY
jgi:hypothetical protein